MALRFSSGRMPPASLSRELLQISYESPLRHWKNDSVLDPLLLRIAKLFDTQSAGLGFLVKLDPVIYSNKMTSKAFATRLEKASQQPEPDRSASRQRCAPCSQT